MVLAPAERAASPAKFRRGPASSRRGVRRSAAEKSPSEKTAADNYYPPRSRSACAAVARASSDASRDGSTSATEGSALPESRSPPLLRILDATCETAPERAAGERWTGGLRRGRLSLFALAALACAATLGALQRLPRLFTEEGRLRLRAALASAAASDWLFLAVAACFLATCLGSVLYNAHHALNARFLRFLQSLVAHRRQSSRRRREGRDAKASSEAAERECESPASARGEKVRVAFVTAHPDDESMFFSPTLALLAASRAVFQVFILTLSNGALLVCLLRGPHTCLPR